MRPRPLLLPLLLLACEPEAAKEKAMVAAEEAKELGEQANSQVVMIDEEGVPYHYRGIEGFLADLRMRCGEDRGTFDLDRWMDGAE